jgi:alpha-glucosidase
VDVIWHLIKDAEFRDNPPNPAYLPTQAEINRYLQVYSADRPEVHDVVAEMRRVLDAYPERVLIGEIYLPLERLVAYYGQDLSGAHLPFNFQLIQAAWNAREIASLINEYEEALPPDGWPNWVLGNHDQPRIGARVGEAQGRVAAMLLLTLRGTPTMYYGDEIGIGKVEIPPEAVQDPWEKNEPGLGLGRDPARTPMPWNGAAQGGFSSGKPWLPLDPAFTARNVDALSDDPVSILTLYRRLIDLRRQHRALSIGSYRPITAEGDLLAYERTHAGERLLIALNLGRHPHTLDLPDGISRAQVLLSTHLDRNRAYVDAPDRANYKAFTSLHRGPPARAVAPPAQPSASLPSPRFRSTFTRCWYKPIPCCGARRFSFEALIQLGFISPQQAQQGYIADSSRYFPHDQ